MSKQSSLINASDANDIRNLPDDVDKLQWIPDTRFRFCGTLIIHLEDHTIGNLIKSELMQDSDVEFVGYRMPHPLEHKIELKVRSSTKDPLNCILESFDRLGSSISNLKVSFNDKVNKF